MSLSEKLRAIVKAAMLDMDYSISVYLEELETRRKALEEERARFEADQAIAMEHLRRGLEALAQGDFEARMTTDLPENFKEMAGYYNDTVDRLNGSFARFAVRPKAFSVAPTRSPTPPANWRVATNRRPVACRRARRLSSSFRSASARQPQC